MTSIELGRTPTGPDPIGSIRSDQNSHRIDRIADSVCLRTLHKSQSDITIGNDRRLSGNFAELHAWWSERIGSVAVNQRSLAYIQARGRQTSRRRQTPHYDNSRMLHCKLLLQRLTKNTSIQHIWQQRDVAPKLNILWLTAISGWVKNVALRVFSWFLRNGLKFLNEIKLLHIHL